MDQVIQRNHIYQFICLFIYLLFFFYFFIGTFLKYRKCWVGSFYHLLFLFTEKHFHFIARDISSVVRQQRGSYNTTCKDKFRFGIKKLISTKSVSKENLRFGAGQNIR